MTVNFDSIVSTVKVTADKYTLNFISILAREAAEAYRKEGCGPLADEAAGLANAIYDALDSKGFYNF